MTEEYGHKAVVFYNGQPLVGSTLPPEMRLPKTDTPENKIDIDKLETITATIDFGKQKVEQEDN